MDSMLAATRKSLQEWVWPTNLLQKLGSYNNYLMFFGGSCFFPENPDRYTPNSVSSLEACRWSNPTLPRWQWGKINHNPCWHYVWYHPRTWSNRDSCHRPWLSTKDAGPFRFQILVLFKLYPKAHTPKPGDTPWFYIWAVCCLYRNVCSNPECR